MTVNGMATRPTVVTATKSDAKTSALLIALFVGLLAVSAWISIPVGPVPVTLQTMVVFLAAALLGPARGAIAVGVYILIGIMGLPVFSSFGAGSAVILGATGGYIAGFILSVIVTGALISKFGRSVPVLAGSMLLGLAICYAFGTIWFMAMSGAALNYVLSVCVTPFILPDAIKIMAAIAIVKLVDYIAASRAKEA